VALGFSSNQRLERLLLKTRNVLGEGDSSFRDDNKTQALQLAAVMYGLYGGDGSETSYSDRSDLTIIQSELVATVAAVELMSSAVSYYKDDLTQIQGPASTGGNFRLDKLAWLTKQLELLQSKIDDLEIAAGFGNVELSGLLIEKIKADCDREFGLINDFPGTMRARI